MPGLVKLSDFLAAHHLPRAERDHWPLVCDQDGIVWIPGFRLREAVAASAGSGEWIEIHIERALQVGAGDRTAAFE